MARSIGYDLHGLEHIEPADIHLSKMSVLGFDISNDPIDKEKLLSNLFFMFIDQNTNKPVILKHSFLLNDTDNDMAFFNHPLHDIWNMKKMDVNMKGVIQKLFNNFDHTNSFYTDAKPVKIDNNEVAIAIANINIADKAVVKNAYIPFEDFYKITVIINAIIFKRLLPINIDKDISYGNYSVKHIKLIRYLGSDLFDKNEKTSSYFAFYSLHCENGDKKGVAVPVLADNSNIMVKSNELKMKSFDSMYKDHFACDMSKLLMWPVIIDDEIVYKIAINRLLPAGRRELLLTEDGVEDSPLLNPLKYIFSK